MSVKTACHGVEYEVRQNGSDGIATPINGPFAGTGVFVKDRATDSWLWKSGGPKVGPVQDADPERNRVLDEAIERLKWG